MEREGEIESWLETESGERIPIRGLCSFGRSSGNTVVLTAPKASRRHALIHEQGDEFWIVDLGSTNGIDINDRRVTHPVKLRPGDRIQMPGIVFTLKQAVGSRPEPGLSDVPPTVGYDLTMAEIKIVKCWLMVADLEGFTPLSQRLPAEELAPAVGRWMADCQEILLKQQGVLAKFLGDGFFAYWMDGDDSAVRIAASFRDFQGLQKAAPLPFRLVFHYGDVSIGSLGGRTADASKTMIGPELNFAFRLEKVASRMKLRSIFSEPAAGLLATHLPLVSCGPQRIPDFEPDRICFTLGE
jgi:adenylate cyclase